MNTYTTTPRTDAFSTLDALEHMARQHCHTGKAEQDYKGQVAGTFVTDSGGLSASAETLEILSAANPSRFRIVAQHGRMIVGYWPENEPMPSALPPESPLSVLLARCAPNTARPLVSENQNAEAPTAEPHPGSL